MNQYLHPVLQASSQVLPAIKPARPFLVEVKNRTGQFSYHGLFATAFDAHIDAVDRVELPAKIYVKELK